MNGAGLLADEGRILGPRLRTRDVAHYPIESPLLLGDLVVMHARNITRIFVMLIDGIHLLFHLIESEVADVWGTGTVVRIQELGKRLIVFQGAINRKAEKLIKAAWSWRKLGLVVVIEGPGRSFAEHLVIFIIRVDVRLVCFSAIGQFFTREGDTVTGEGRVDPLFAAIVAAVLQVCRDSRKSVLLECPFNFFQIQASICHPQLAADIGERTDRDVTGQRLPSAARFFKSLLDGMFHNQGVEVIGQLAGWAVSVAGRNQPAKSQFPLWGDFLKSDLRSLSAFGKDVTGQL